MSDSPGIHPRLGVRDVLRTCDLVTRAAVGSLSDAAAPTLEQAIRAAQVARCSEDVVGAELALNQLAVAAIGGLTMIRTSS
jgi:hypothetical protein